MDTRVTAARVGTAIPVSLSALHPGTAATIVRVGSAAGLGPVETRLLELGFICGETVEVVAEARP
ncbi:MAG TPA: FeoA family protein, partial [Steroidobacteraceae bacterium]|nr:FeoA family protein [Steroidobacteraceae bacterium]